MRPPHAVLLLSAALLSAALLAGCGGDGGSPEDDIRGIIEEGARNPPSLCGHPHYEALKYLGGEEKCRDLARSADNTDRDVEVRAIDVEADKATARVRGKDGDRTLTFRKQDGDWRLSGE